MSQTTSTATGVVLAGGRSTRFGSDKLAARYGHDVLLHRAIRSMWAVCEDVVVVLGPDQAEPELPTGIAARLARDAETGLGPLAGILTGLATTTTELAVIAGGDMPELDPRILTVMVTALREEGVDAVVLRDEGVPRPAPLVVRVGPARAAAAALLKSGERSVRRLIEGLRAHAISEDAWRTLDPSGRTLRDVDEPGDLLGPGRIGVSVICEGWAPLPLDDECPGHEIDWDQERVRHPWAFAGPDTWRWHVHAFWLRTPAGDVVVDTGVGSFGPWAPWAETPTADPWSGLDRNAVRHVVLTHLHADHAGGVVDADGAPRFPNARYHVHPADWSHFAGGAVIRRWDGQRYDARDAVSSMADSGAVSLVADDHEVSPGVHAVHAPGHTPGHRCIVVEDRDETLLLAGDLLHSPIQVARPDWPSAHDVDANLGCRSRARLLERAASGGWSVAISHFARPFGTVEADDRGKRWQSAP